MKIIFYILKIRIGVVGCGEQAGVYIMCHRQLLSINTSAKECENHGAKQQNSKLLVRFKCSESLAGTSAEEYDSMLPLLYEPD